MYLTMVGLDKNSTFIFQLFKLVSQSDPVVNIGENEDINSRNKAQIKEYIII